MMKGAVEEESSLACKLRGLYCGQTRTQDHTAFIVFIPLLVVRLFHISYLESFPAQVSGNEAQPETQYCRLSHREKAAAAGKMLIQGC